jgi:hypothetical protein
MTDLIVVPQAAHWQRLKRLVLDSVSSPITRRVYNLGLDEFFEWYGHEPRPGFTKATVCAWRVALEARGLGAVSINVRITAVRKLAVEASDNGLLAPELANGITRVKGVASKGVRLGNWLSVRQAQTLRDVHLASDHRMNSRRFSPSCRSGPRRKIAVIRHGDVGYLLLDHDPHQLVDIARAIQRRIAGWNGGGRMTQQCSSAGGGKILL